MLKLILLLSIAFTSCSRPEQPSLVGNWMTEKVVFKNSMGDKSTSTVYDRQNSDSIKDVLFKKYKSQDTSDSDFVQIDTVEFKANLEKTFRNFDLSRLNTKSDSTFFMESFRLIIPTALPGWHFGDTLIGKWKINKPNYLVLTLGDNDDSYTSFYKIIKFTKDRLTIGQTNENNGEPFLKIEFVRQ